jgi:putative chitinase
MTLGMILEDGWPECDPGDCDNLTIPGTPLSLLIQRGQPHAIMQAFFRDMDAYIEPANNSRGYADEGSWTQDNSVYTSNHKGATAVDWNWSDHPMGKALSGWNGSIYIKGSQEPAVRELLAWYEGMIFWGNDWNTPKDSMHFQMGYNTYGSQNVARVQSFIDRKIRADGYSTFKRGGVPRGGGTAVEPSTPANPIEPTSGLTAQVLADLMHGNVSVQRCEFLLPRLLQAFHVADINTIDRRAMAVAQLGHESVDLEYQTEIWGPTKQQLTYDGRMGNNNPGDGFRYRGRDFLQITGKDNYSSLSRWAYQVQIPGVTSPTFFVDNPDALATDTFAFVGFAWYWKVARSGLNAAADARNLEEATRLINGGQTGIDDRRRRYTEALAVNADLLDPETDPLEELFMANTEVESLSIYATPGEPNIPLVRLVQSIDAAGHRFLVEEAARLGDTDSLSRIARTASGQGKYRDPATVAHAAAVLADIEATNPSVLQAFLKGQSA